MKKSNIKTIVLYIALILVVVFAASALLSSMNAANKLSYSEIIELFETNQVKEFKIESNGKLTLVTVEGKQYSRVLLDFYTFRKDVDPYLGNSNLTGYDYAEPSQNSWILNFLPYLLMVVVMVVFWIVFMKKAGGAGGAANFGKSRARLLDQDKKRVLFSDVAGADEEKEELREIVEFLKSPEKYRKLGARIPRGVLLQGPPGTGKTLLAKAVAGEAGVPFLSISGSDFVEMYVGVGASRVRDLFETAKKAPASIVFIDEIDAVGRHRGAGLGGGHDEREQTLNQLLVEMDGFGSHDGVIVIAATNRPDILDPALLRPGRFDRQVTVGYPDIQGREDILKVHSRGKPFEADVDFKKIAQTTVGFTGADLANLLNEAALIAARKAKTLIGMGDIDDAMIKITVGTQKKKNKIKDSEKRKTAYHEAGHAILAHILPTQDPVRQISIIPSGRALGYTLNPPTEDKYSVYKNELKERIMMLLGGRAAEEIVYGDVSGGASNDIMRATQTARKMVTELGMSDVIGNIRLGSDHDEDTVFLGRDFSSGKNYSEETAALIDAEVKKIIDEAYAKAKALLMANREKLDFITDFLCKYEIMDDGEFAKAMEDGTTMAELDFMVEQKRQKSHAENEAQRKANEEAARREEEERKKRDEELERMNKPYGDLK
ncbi:MAG: ATP-dependent zinc metalloprotease FtsH [Clostridia bacterium]|nr:ATP-dependent zinc metalloprotease FtsH [Clostridia bacterium]